MALVIPTDFVHFVSWASQVINNTRLAKSKKHFFIVFLSEDLQGQIIFKF